MDSKFSTKDYCRAVAQYRIDYPEDALWQILVPTLHSDGRPIKTRFHRVWDAKVREITGGLTINRPVIGQWVNDEDILFKERMIPVQIACSEKDIFDIANFTKKYYNQEKVFFYKLSKDVYIV